MVKLWVFGLDKKLLQLSESRTLSGKEFQEDGACKSAVTLNIIPYAGS